MSDTTLRWMTWGDEGAWHLRFGADGPPICDRFVPGPATVKERTLEAGPPSKRCRDCRDTIKFRLGVR